MIINKPETWKEVTGIFVGGCIKRGEGSSFRAKAHAHNQKNTSHYGWICVRSLKRIGDYVSNDDGSLSVVKPSRVLWHEYAHILTPNHGHDDVWRAKMKELKQPLAKQYHKKVRCVHQWSVGKYKENVVFNHCLKCDLHRMRQLE